MSGTGLVARASFMALVVLAACAEAPRPEVAPSPYRITDANGEEAVLGIFCEPSRRVRLNEPPPGRTVVVAVWQDGRIVWSDDRVQGGPPYRTSRLPSARIEVLRDEVCAVLDEHGDEYRGYLCGASIHVVASCGGATRSLMAPHEHYPESHYSMWSSGDRAFRAAWDSVTDLLRDAIPESGEEMETGVDVVLLRP